MAHDLARLQRSLEWRDYRAASASAIEAQLLAAGKLRVQQELDTWASLAGSGAAPAGKRRATLARVLAVTTVALVASATLPWAAVAAFWWSLRSARILLSTAAVVAVLGGLAGAAAGHGALAVWSLVFSWAACGCCVIAARHLLGRPARWIHRFVIYAGYGATFGAMAAAGLWLDLRTATVGLAAIVLIGVWLIGSASIFIAKTLTVRFVAKTMPDYIAALGTDPSGGYW